MAPAISRRLAQGCAISADQPYDYCTSGYVLSVTDGVVASQFLRREQNHLPLESSGWVCGAGHSGTDADLLWWRFFFGEWRRRRGHQWYPQAGTYDRYGHREFYLRRDYIEPQCEAYFGRAVTARPTPLLFCNDSKTRLLAAGAGAELFLVDLFLNPANLVPKIFWDREGIDLGMSPL